jgi:hypothetical protein
MGDGALSSVIRTLSAGAFVNEIERSTLIPAELVADAAILVCAFPIHLSENWLIQTETRL